MDTVATRETERKRRRLMLELDHAMDLRSGETNPEVRAEYSIAIADLRYELGRLS